MFSMERDRRAGSWHTVIFYWREILTTANGWLQPNCGLRKTFSCFPSVGERQPSKTAYIIHLSLFCRSKYRLKWVRSTHKSPECSSGRLFALCLVPLACYLVQVQEQQFAAGHNHFATESWFELPLPLHGFFIVIVSYRRYGFRL